MKKFYSLALALLATLFIAACGGEKKPAYTLAEEILDKIVFADGVLANVTSDLDLAPKIFFDGEFYDITWSTSNAAVITTAGKVTRPDFEAGNATVTLTASATADSETKTKDFTATVIKKAEVLPVTPKAISEVYTLANKTEGVTVKGIVTGLDLGTNNKGFYVADATGQLFVFIRNNVPGVAGITNVQIGDEVQVTGMKDNYFGAIQLSTKASPAIPEWTVLSSGNTVPAATTYTTEEIKNLPAINVENHRAPEVYGKLVTTSGLLTQANATKFMIDGIEVYTNGVEGVSLEAAVGKQVTITAILKTFHTGNSVWQLIYQGAELEISEASQEEKIAAVKAELDKLAKTYNADFVLPLEVLETTVAYTSNSEFAVIGEDGKTVTVTLQETEQTVTLTATFTVSSAAEATVYTVEVKLAAKTVEQEVYILDTNQKTNSIANIKALFEAVGDGSSEELAYANAGTAFYGLKFGKSGVGGYVTTAASYTEIKTVEIMAAAWKTDANATIVITCGSLTATPTTEGGKIASSDAFTGSAANQDYSSNATKYTYTFATACTGKITISSVESKSRVFIYEIKLSK